MPETLCGPTGNIANGYESGGHTTRSGDGGESDPTAISAAGYAARPTAKRPNGSHHAG
ncbi:MAG: hypothetical protein PHE50_01885 [Dehalococcoidales bacterium]|nr:hypothetical protein [Dehalococcoidales bacterium]